MQNQNMWLILIHLFNIRKNIHLTLESSPFYSLVEAKPCSYLEIYISLYNTLLYLTIAYIIII